ncbi:MAG: hypothetical protein IJ201_05975 [Solobacterium sp.]|nr:hypothetical protein [Solobacterium sp.]
MTNIYPFPVGQAAIFHECIDRFPDAEEPENHALSVHCSYAGFAPRMICRRKWKAMPKVLAIVNEKATMVDCELPVSDMVLAKINPPFDKITVIPGEIEKFVQFPDTDFLNATLLHDQKGEKGVEELPFHHRMIIVRKQKAKIVQIAKDFG